MIFREHIDEQRNKIIKSRLVFSRMPTPRTGKELFGRTKALKVKPFEITIFKTCTIPADDDRRRIWEN